MSLCVDRRAGDWVNGKVSRCVGKRGGWVCGKGVGTDLKLMEQVFSPDQPWDLLNGCINQKAVSEQGRSSLSRRQTNLN